MSPDALTAFHPAVAGWFRSRFPEPTETQRHAWVVTFQQRNALIAAPTGSGKTPPRILVTTPESLFILLTSESGRTRTTS